MGGFPKILYSFDVNKANVVKAEMFLCAQHDEIEKFLVVKAETLSCAQGDLKQKAKRK